MNFLAHLYLSGNNNDIMIGNFISDSVKGKLYLKYREGIQHGILLHRKIDGFTDKHPITKELKSLLKNGYHKHSGIVIDIFYDHFLCLNWEKYSSISLKKFISLCHRVILRNLFILPSDIKGYLPFLIARKRLHSYSNIEGIENTLKTMSKYTSLPDSSIFAIQILKENYAFFNTKFQEFFIELIMMVKKELEITTLR
jgi:acyl carrier protein phosphodiesterase